MGLGNVARFELQQEGKEAGRAEGAAGTGKRNGVCGAEGGVATAPAWLWVQEARRAPSEHSEVLAALWFGGLQGRPMAVMSQRRHLGEFSTHSAAWQRGELQYPSHFGFTR